MAAPATHPARLRRWLGRLRMPGYTLLALSIVSALQAQDSAYSQSDFGGVGLLQTPTARMAEEGEFSFVVSRTKPYTNFNLSLQPLTWLEGSFRYTSVSNRKYGVTADQSYKDKSIDVKIRVWQESHWLPSVAVGGRDISGTGLFSSEYVVASKRFGALDVTLGMAWGYMGSRGDFANPLDVFGDRFKSRPTTATLAGEFRGNKYFRGRVGVFGGVQYQSPLHWLVLKAELDGNDYKHQPQQNNQPQRWPVNVGAMFRINGNTDLTVAYERGEIATVTLSLHANLKNRKAPPKLFDAAPEPVSFTATAVATITPPPQGQPALSQRLPPAAINWRVVTKTMYNNAGIDVSKISRRGAELVVYGVQKKFFYTAQGLGRLTRIIDNRVDSSIRWVTWASQSGGMNIVESSVERSRFVALLDHRIDLGTLRQNVEQDPVTPRTEEVLYQQPLKRFVAGTSIGYQQSLGGPDAFVLYQIYAVGNATINFTRHLWLDGVVTGNLINNYDKFTYDAPSNLPRVRTDIRRYLTDSRITMTNLQITGTRRLGQDLYGMAYAGMLESMFGGVGGEALYRPFGEHWALGMDLNWVKQRGYRQDFSFRAYHVVTGMATAYVQTGYHDVLLSVGIGRYLAGDWGTTWDVSRVFSNGARMGAFVTITNKSGSRGYGEGGFDKGIYVSIPFDLLLPRSARSQAVLLWQPLLRDGGARLGRRYSLYGLTSDLDDDNFRYNLEKISQ